MKNKLSELAAASEKAIASVTSLEGLEELRVKFLGKKGELTAILKMMGSSPPRSARSWASWPTPCGPRWRRD
jgi:phenylalanyl-tRNA synthetase alpha chain